MTQPPDNALRGQLLGDLLGDCLSLSHIDSVVAQVHSESADTVCQYRLVAAIGSGRTMWFAHTESGQQAARALPAQQVTDQ